MSSRDKSKHSICYISTTLIPVPFSPYYPRGTIRVIKSVKETEISSNETVPGVNDQEDPDADDMTANDIIRIDSLEPSFQDLVQSAALNNMATLRRGEENSPWTAVGDPTEIALQVFAHKAGFGKPHLYV